MRTLSQQAFENARTYIATQGRELDARRFRFYFEAGSAGHVLAALAPYQNTDGGFGHGLEADLCTHASSAVATQQAFNIFREVNAPAAEPLVQRAVAYLLNTLDPAQDVWPIIPPEVEDAPHAPWWEYATSAENFDGFKANPRAALVGHLHYYAELVPDAILERLRRATLEHFHSQPDEIDMHALHCYLTLAGAPGLPGGDRERMWAKLRRVVAAAVETDPSRWDDYVLMPLDVAATPDSPLANIVPQEAIHAHLDWLIERQQPDGSWPLPWSWEFVDAEAWARARRDWNGQRAVNILRTLRAYGRLPTAA